MAKKAKKKLPMTPMPEGSTLKINFLPDGEIEARMYGARTSKAKVCAFCKHTYLKPCDDKAKDKCPNFLFIQQKAKGKAKRK